MLNPSVERVVLGRYPTENGEIQLQWRQLMDGTAAFEIISDGVFLMASYNQHSERLLTEVALENVKMTPFSNMRVLVGGLGMGFTLQQALAAGVGSVDVAEVSPYIVEWNRTHFAPLNRRALADSRVRLIRADLVTILCQLPPLSYHAILLDVDNGPSWLSQENNVRLYTVEALERWVRILRPGGSLAVWSAQPEPEFLARMEAVFGQADEIRVNTPEYQGRELTTFIYRATAPRSVPLDIWQQGDEV